MPQPLAPRLTPRLSPKAAPKPVNYGRTNPALSTKVRDETSQALEQALRHEKFAGLRTGLEELVIKVANAHPEVLLPPVAASPVGRGGGLKGLMVGGALAAGGLMLADHIKRTPERNPLVYAPMTGGL